MLLPAAREHALDKPRDVVVMAASAGGIEALGRLLQRLPRDLAATVLIVQHTSPSPESLLAEVLSRCSALPVGFGVQGQAVAPGHVYLAPPDLHMTVAPSGTVALDRGPKERHVRPAADPL